MEAASTDVCSTSDKMIATSDGSPFCFCTIKTVREALQRQAKIYLHKELEGKEKI